MNSLELFLLGRKLANLGESSMPSDGLRKLPTTVKLVLFDVYEHPATTIGDICGRTGLLQSQVSTSVARLCTLGVFQTEVDPADRRRTLVRGNPDVARQGARLAYESIDKVIAKAVAFTTTGEVEELVSMLDKIANRLIANALTWTRSNGEPK